MEKNKSFRILLVAGDGIGPEVMQPTKKMLEYIQDNCSGTIEWEDGIMGAAGIDLYDSNLPEITWEAVKRSDAILHACTGDSRYDHLELIEQPGAALLKLRKRLELFANIRPIKSYPELIDSTVLKASAVRPGIDLLIIRELTGGLYFGEPRGMETLANGEKRAVDTMVYTTGEIQRIGRIAFEAAKSRKKLVTSVDKANVLWSSRLWREVIIDIAEEYPAIKLDHRYVDSFAMQLVLNPTLFDVIVSENTFGDILSDLASVFVGSLGLLPSASMGDETWIVDGEESRLPWLYEPVHGSAPDIAGMDKANPIAMILSLAMLFRYSLKDDKTAQNIEIAVANVISAGYRTPDLYTEGKGTLVGTERMGEMIFKELKKLQ